MIAKTLLRLASRIPGVASDLAEWYEEAGRVAEEARRHRLEDEANDNRDRRDMSRWLQQPDRRRPAQRKRRGTP